ncbi:MAG: hypothetical protein ACRC2O_04945 [Chitinophagaceae bacterium]
MTGIIATLFALGLFNVIYAFTGATAPFGIYYPAANVFLTILMFAALAGLWSMEKWGLWLFLVFVGLKLILDIWTHAFHYAELLLLIPVVLFLLKKKELE